MRKTLSFSSLFLVFFKAVVVEKSDRQSGLLINA
jgi:hypothetical protein